MYIIRLLDDYTYGFLVFFDFIKYIGYLVRPTAQKYGTFVLIPRPQLHVNVAIGFYVELRTPSNFAIIINGNFRFGKHTNGWI